MFGDTVRVGDLDSNGFLDIVVSDDLGQAFYIYWNDSTEFTDIDTTEFPTRVTGLEVQDFDGDGFPDIVVGSDCVAPVCLRDTLDTNDYDDSIYVYINDGSGGFAAPEPYSHGLGLLDQLGAGDIDLDGDIDLVASEGDAQTEVGVIENLGDGTFAAADKYVVGGIPYGVELTDYDNDDYLDLVVSIFNEHKIGILMNADDDTPTFDTLVTTIRPGNTLFPLQIAVGDLNDDGNVDIVTSSNQGSGMAWYIRGTGSSSGTFGDVGPVIPDTADGTGFSAAVGDLDADGHQEIIVGNENRLMVFFNCVCGIPKSGDVNVTGTITSADVIVLNNYIFLGGAEPWPCDAAGDVNCSGTLTSGDIIALSSYVNTSSPVPCNVCNSVVPSPFDCQ